jgi:hypothetical protein
MEHAGKEKRKLMSNEFDAEQEARLIWGEFFGHWSKAGWDRKNRFMARIKAIREDGAHRQREEPDETLTRLRQELEAAQAAVRTLNALKCGPLSSEERDMLVEEIRIRDEQIAKIKSDNAGKPNPPLDIEKITQEAWNATRNWMPGYGGCLWHEATNQGRAVALVKEAIRLAGLAPDEDAVVVSRKKAANLLWKWRTQVPQIRQCGEAVSEFAKELGLPGEPSQAEKEAQDTDLISVSRKKCAEVLAKNSTIDPPTQWAFAIRGVFKELGLPVESTQAEKEAQEIERLAVRYSVAGKDKASGQASRYMMAEAIAWARKEKG